MTKVHSSLIVAASATSVMISTGARGFDDSGGTAIMTGATAGLSNIQHQGVAG